MKKYLSLLLLIALFFGVGPTTFATSQQTIEFSQKEFLLFSSGKSLQETVTLKNLEGTPKAVYLSWIPYSKTNTKTLNQTFQTKHSIDFAELAETKINLQPFESRAISILFQLPDNLESGDYYGLLHASDQQSTLEVPFTIRKLGKLTDSIAARASLNEKNLTIEISNTSNKTTQIEISADINGLLDDVEKIKFNDTKLLAGEKVSFKSNKLDLLPGYYQARIDIKYSERDLNKVLLISFWVHPEFFVVSVLTLFVSILGFVYFRFYFRSNVT